MEKVNLRQKLNKLKNQKKFGEIENIISTSNLTEREYWLMKYCYIKDLMVENICPRLNISRPYYHIIKNLALTKIDFLHPELKV